MPPTTLASTSNMIDFKGVILSAENWFYKNPSTSGPSR